MVRDRVNRGVELLDRERPGWWREVDVDRLNIRSFSNCLLGMLYGDFHEGARHLDMEVARDFDFSQTPPTSLHGFDFQGANPDDLTAEWKRVISVRVLAHRRVAAGASLLDGARPDWFTSVDLAKLEVASQGGCVLGQVYGMYTPGMKALGLEAWGDLNPTEHGTRGDGQLHGFGFSEETPAEALVFAWREAIGDRLEAEAEDRARVSRGAELLDRLRPGWRDRIDLETFEISSHSDCVLGQVYRDHNRSGDLPGFIAGLHDLDLYRMEGEEFLPMRLGFTAPFSDTLQAAWVAEIERSAGRCVRRGAALLDEKRPGWHREVDLGLLDMPRNDHCVFGQLWGGCLEAWAALGIEAGKGEGDRVGMYDTDVAPYSELQAHWIAAIATRRDGDAPGAIDFSRVPPAPRGFRQRLAESLISFYARCFSR